MKILIDIIHTADVNFYKNAILQLQKEGHQVSVSYMKRGRVPKVVANEYKEVELIALGKHYKSFLGKIYGIIAREILFLKLYNRNKFDVVTGFGFYSGMLAKFFGIKAVHFHDDKEYKKNYFLTKHCATKFIALCSDSKTNKTTPIKSFKELAYLHPNYFKEDILYLKKLHIKKEKYVYVREVNNISLNYAEQKKIDFTQVFKFLKEKGYTIIYDSESEKSHYLHTQLLKPPWTREESNTLLKHAALCISTGDTMPRESALLGIPTIYASNRVMSANKHLEEVGLINRAPSEKEILKLTKRLLMPGVKKEHREKAKKIVSEYEDMTKIILSELTK